MYLFVFSLSGFVLAACGQDPGASLDGGVTQDAAGTAGDGGDGGDGGVRSTWAPQAWEDCEGGGQSYEAGPEDYRDVLDTLNPGDTLNLRSGSYLRGLPIRRSGNSDACIVIQASDLGARPLFIGSNSWNIVAVHGASWVKVRGLDIDGDNKAGFGVASQGGTDSPTHHVVIEDLTMVGLGSDQQIVGVSTKSPAWDWVIRGNTITGAGTGMYLGNSDGNQPFVRGVVEFNTILDTTGYSMQIKHQNPRPQIEGIPQQSETVIRWNVFSKSSGASMNSARPNLLLGHWPSSGAGVDDRYLVYGNFFYDNPSEMLLQAEGNVAIYNNVFVNPNGGAITIRPHNDVPKTVDVAFNTVWAQGRGIQVSGQNEYAQRVRYNAVFASSGISAADQVGNVTGDYNEASSAFEGATSGLEGMNLHPKAGQLMQSVSSSELPVAPGIEVDFDGVDRVEDVAGAYSSGGGAQSYRLGRQARSY